MLSDPNCNDVKTVSHQAHSKQKSKYLACPLLTPSPAHTCSSCGGQTRHGCQVWLPRVVPMPPHECGYRQMRRESERRPPPLALVKVSSHWKTKWIPKAACQERLLFWGVFSRRQSLKETCQQMTPSAGQSCHGLLDTPTAAFGRGAKVGFPPSHPVFLLLDKVKSCAGS